MGEREEVEGSERDGRDGERKIERMRETEKDGKRKAIDR